MDKYEFNLKMEQIRKLVGDNDYATALKVVDGIDWNRVRNTNLLTLAASVYEENGKLDEAMDLLSMAFQRAPVGKRILYKLTELSVRCGDVEKAEEYYHEYNSVASDDPGCLLLQYMILKVKHAPYQQLIQCLELYNQYEPDEKWMYELATTYESAGRIQDCVGLCDRIALMFGGTVYGVKALKLKQKYTKLTDEQRALLYPNSIASSGVHYAANDAGYVSQPLREQARVPELSLGDRLAANRIENEDELFAAYAAANGPMEPVPAPVRREASAASGYEAAAPAAQKIQPVQTSAAQTAYAPVQDASFAYETNAAQTVPAAQDVPEVLSASAAASVNAAPEAYEAPAAPEAYTAPAGEGTEYEETSDGTPSAVNAGFIMPEEPAVAEEKGYLDSDYTEPVSAPSFVPASVKDPDAETLLADAQIASAKIENPVVKQEPERLHPQARTTFTVAEPVMQETPAYAPAPAAPQEAVKETPLPAPAHEVREYPGYHLIVEAEDDQEGLDIAVDELKLIHAKNGINNGAVKTTGEKLMEKGLSEKAIAKIVGKDFVIEHAGEIEGEVADIICDFLKGRGKNTNVILIDNGDGLDRLESDKPEIFDICNFITDEEARDKDYSTDAPAAVSAAPAPIKKEAEESFDPDATRVIAKKPQNVPLYQPADNNEVMSTDDFAQYCCKYASDIDCTITGKSMLALYERIELMEEDGIALTKQAAEDLIEETADRAEKPPIGKRVTGLFKSKYDKDGLLILKEEDFIY